MSLVVLTLAQCHVLYRARFKEGHFAPITRFFHWGLIVTTTKSMYMKELSFITDIKTFLPGMSTSLA